MVVAQHCGCTKCHGIVHFKVIACILCEFDLNLLIMRNNRGTGKAVKVRGQGNPGVNTRRERAEQKKMEKIKGVVCPAHSPRQHGHLVNIWQQCEEITAQGSRWWEQRSGHWEKEGSFCPAQQRADPHRGDVSITGAWWPTLIFASKVEASDHETKLDFQGPSSSLAPSGSLFPMLFCDCMLFCFEVTPCPHWLHNLQLLHNLNQLLWP